jgi:hypothetical protein
MASVGERQIATPGERLHNLRAANEDSQLHYGSDDVLRRCRIRGQIARASSVNAAVTSDPSGDVESEFVVYGNSTFRGTAIISTAVRSPTSRHGADDE